MPWVLFGLNPDRFALTCVISPARTKVTTPCTELPGVAASTAIADGSSKTVGPLWIWQAVSTVAATPTAMVLSNVVAGCLTKLINPWSGRFIASSQGLDAQCTET